MNRWRGRLSAWGLASLSALAAGPAVAQEARPRQEALTQYRIDGWQTEQGLPLNTVQTILQTRDGYLWVGTGGGLARFDGTRFTTFESREVPEISSVPIFGLWEDDEGLWIGHAKGAAIYRGGRFEPAFGPEVTQGRRVWAFARGKDGALWATTEHGLIRSEKGATRVYGVSDGLPTERLRAITVDRDGTVWIGTTGGGLVSFREGRFETLDPRKGFPHLEVRHVLPDPEGGVWAATAGGGLVHVRGKEVRVYSVAEGLPTDQLTMLARDSQGSIWIGTWGSGVSRFSSGRFSTISTSGGLSGDQIWCLHVDREGNVWIGSWVGGLNRLSRRAFEVIGPPEGLTNPNVRAIVPAREGGMWVTTAGGGVNRVDGQRITSVRKKNGLPTDETSTLLEESDGSLWIGTYTGGLARYRKGAIETFGTSSGLPSVDVRAVFRDRTGTLWVGTMAGLARLKDRGFEPVTSPGAPRIGVTSILQDRSGALWFATSEGLIRYQDGAFRTFTRNDGLLSNWIMSLHEDASGSLWIGTNGEGLNRLRDGRFASIRTADGLWDGNALVILEDRLGNFWMTCNRGFYRVSRDELNAFADGRASRVTSRSFGPGDSLRSTTFSGGHQAAGALDARGQLWLPSFNGLVVVDPATLPGSGPPPAVAIEGVTIDGLPAPLGTEVVLPPGSLPLTVRYTVMTMVNAERARFRYQMDGLTHDWVDAGRLREAVFPALPHGDYRFRVAASTDGTQWREATNPLPIRVKPYLYQTPWFLTVASLAGVLLIGGLVRLRTHQLRQRHAQMERLVAERTEELRLANEHLSRLSFVDGLTGLANRRRFDEILDKEWRRATRFQTWLSVILADIDGFKAYNDALGHLEGDRCLASVAGVFLQSVSRAGDLAARYGGEEFVILIPAAEPASARAFAERLRRACEGLKIPHPASPAGPVVTISLGVASCIPSEENPPASLVAAADAALYRAKQEGRNRVC